MEQQRVSAYRIIEDTLNLRDVRIYDYVEDDDRKKKAVLNKKETAIAQGKQDLIKQAFQDWIWKEPERSRDLLIITMKISMQSDQGNMMEVI